MKTKARRTITYFTDQNGYRCTRVPVAGSALPAILFAEDWEQLSADGLTANWHLNASASGPNALAYVKAYVPGSRDLVIARLVTKAGKGRQVHYRNGNRLDLRGDNLLVSKGGRAVKDCATALANSHAISDAEDER